ncbi:transposase [Bradyrhizobium sp. LA6.10]|uniref:transposase n=2 Tax=unclassified Bradyrhizobium TaxID=2631580 RepID=UPI0033970575
MHKVRFVSRKAHHADAGRLMSIPGSGPLIAATVRTSVLDARGFATARDFAAWTGFTPRAQSSDGRERLGAISKHRNRKDVFDRWCDLNHQSLPSEA